MKAGFGREAARARLRGTTSIALAAFAGLLTPVAAQAQTAEEQEKAASSDAAKDEKKGDVVVTSTRVDRIGFVAPTPTTVVTSEELRQGGRTNVGAALNDLPQFRATLTPATTSNVVQPAGFYGADLRGLGNNRTLVLLDGVRPVSTNANNFNLNTLPFILVDRTDVVTGGATAAWGSGAVAGVVNVLLDDDLVGLRANAQYGLSTRGDGAEYTLSGAFGSSFAGGRGHIVVAGEYVDDEGITPATARPWNGRTQLVANPAYTATNGLPEFIFLSDGFRFSTRSRGGLINVGPPSLVGLQFGPGGVLQPFDAGTRYGTTFSDGGEGPTNNDVLALSVPVRRENVYAIGSFDVTDSIRFRTDLRYSHTFTRVDLFPEPNLDNALVISRENAFLPAAVRAEMVRTGRTSITVGRFSDDIGIVENNNDQKTLQAIAALDGNFGSNWRWDAYYTYGRNKGHNETKGQRVVSLFREALDSVISPTTGLPICRSALTVPTTACVPLNIFGSGSPSAQSIAYFTANSYLDTRSTLKAAAANLRGEPFSTWAGPVSVAFGAEWRREEVDVTVDPLSATGRFVQNFVPLSGGFSVKEGYAEVVVPLAKDLPLIKSLEVNGAIRLSDYSGRQSQTSWKVGSTYQVIDGLRLRATHSKDARAPNISELYTLSTFNQPQIQDPFQGNRSYVVIVSRGGNPNLDNETAYTTTAGVTYTPQWLPGFSLSADYYDITVNGAISTLLQQQILDRCFNGNAELCNLIERDAQNNITRISAPNINLATFELSGVDFELAYISPPISQALPGRIRFRLLGTWADHLVQDDGVSPRYEAVGNLGAGTGGVPDWRITAAVGYKSDRLGVDLRTRFINGGFFDATRNISDNSVPSRTYFDLGLQYSLDPKNRDRIVLRADVRNLLDKEPPLAPNSQFFDVIGRYFTMGVRVAL